MAAPKLYAGAKLRELRTRLGLTQRRFAEQLGVSLPYLNQMENNNRPVSTSVVLALALWHGEIDADTASDASLVDALFEIERWGEERDAGRRHEALRRDMRGVARFLENLPPDRPDGASPSI